MTWRQVPPVFSPVSARALFDGALASLGLLADRSSVIEEMLCRRYNATHSVLTDSGTSAIVAVLRQLLPRNATVALPAFCCVDLAAVAVAAGVRVRLYDLDPATLSPDLDSVRSVLNRGTDAVIVAHLYGYPADVPEVQRLARERGVPVIEDAAQAAGGALGDRLLGSFGDVAVLSFGRGKGTTSGSGGAVLTKSTADDYFAGQVRQSLETGSGGATRVIQLLVQDIFSRPSLYSLPSSIPLLRLGEMVYHDAGMPRAMSRASAAILGNTLVGIDAEVDVRRRRVAELTTSIRTIASVSPVRAIERGTPGFLRMALLDLAGSLEPRPDLGALRSYPLTLDQHPQLYASLLPGERAGKGSQYLRERLFTIPTHARSPRSHASQVSSWLRTRHQPVTGVPVFS